MANPAERPSAPFAGDHEECNRVLNTGLRLYLGLGRDWSRRAPVIVALVLPSFLTVKFVAPDYKMLSLVRTLSVLAYAATLWRLEFSPGETNLLRQVIWPRLAVKRGDE